MGGDGIHDDTEAVRKTLEYASKCGCSEIVFGPMQSRFLVFPGKIKVELKHCVLRFEGDIVGPTLHQWNPANLQWPKGSCAYGEKDCGDMHVNPEYSRSKW